MPTIEGWSKAYTQVVRELVRSAASSLGTDPWHAAALRTGGLPVYCDIGGCLVITPDGDILEYAFEGEIVTPVTDQQSMRLACAAAAEKYEMLATLMPKDGRVCPSCSGTGRLGQTQMRCGVCAGIGLVVDR